jgi:DNA polymerase (family 10)
MARTAKQLGHRIIAITDHITPMGIVNSLNEKKLKKYIAAIKKARRKVKGIKILIGAEIDINKDGNLTATKPMLKQLDFVLAGVHSAFRQSEQVMTKRLIHALENYPINALAHPTGRLINERPPYRFDLDKVFQAAKDHNTYLEIDAYPNRLDLNGEHIKIAKEIGCKFTIGTDSHTKDHLRFIELGTAMARRGWLEKKHVLNTYPINRILKLLKK